MKNHLFTLLALCVFLVGCGSGSGGGSDPIVPTNPQVPPTSYQSYAGVVQSKGGSFAAQGNNVAEWHSSELRLVFSTAPFGNVTVFFPPANSSGYHGTVMINAVQYNVWFWPQQNSLNMTDLNSVNYASWTVTQIVANG